MWTHPKIQESWRNRFLQVSRRMNQEKSSWSWVITETLLQWHSEYRKRGRVTEGKGRVKTEKAKK